VCAKDMVRCRRRKECRCTSREEFATEYEEGFQNKTKGEGARGLKSAAKTGSEGGNQHPLLTRKGKSQMKSQVEKPKRASLQGAR